MLYTSMPKLLVCHKKAVCLIIYKKCPLAAAKR